MKKKGIENDKMLLLLPMSLLLLLSYARTKSGVRCKRWWWLLWAEHQ